MKTNLKILLLAAVLVVMTACSAEKRAARRVRRAVAECPGLVQVKAHPIEGTVTAPAFADAATLPLAAVLQHDTLYAATQHGTVVVSLRQSDSALRVGFVAAPREIRYQDTVRYAQVEILPDGHAHEASHEGREFLAGVLCFAAGIAAALYLLLRKKP